MLYLTLQKQHQLKLAVCIIMKSPTQLWHTQSNHIYAWDQPHNICIDFNSHTISFVGCFRFPHNLPAVLSAYLTGNNRFKNKINVYFYIEKLLKNT